MKDHISKTVMNDISSTPIGGSIRDTERTYVSLSMEGPFPKRSFLEMVPTKIIAMFPPALLTVFSTPQLDHCIRQRDYAPSRFWKCLLQEMKS